MSKLLNFKSFSTLDPGEKNELEQTRGYTIDSVKSNILKNCFHTPLLMATVFGSSYVIGTSTPVLGLIWIPGAVAGSLAIIHSIHKLSKNPAFPRNYYVYALLGGITACPTVVAPIIPAGIFIHSVVYHSGLALYLKVTWKKKNMGDVGITVAGSSAIFVVNILAAILLPGLIDPTLLETIQTNLVIGAPLCSMWFAADTIRVVQGFKAGNLDPYLAAIECMKGPAYLCFGTFGILFGASAILVLLEELGEAIRKKFTTEEESSQFTLCFVSDTRDFFGDRPGGYEGMDVSFFSSPLRDSHPETDLSGLKRDVSLAVVWSTGSPLRSDYDYFRTIFSDSSL